MLRRGWRGRARDGFTELFLGGGGRGRCCGGLYYVILLYIILYYITACGLESVWLRRKGGREGFL